MPDQVQNQNSDSNGSKGGDTGYSREYVHELREEAAGYRTRLKEAEMKLQDMVKAIESQKTQTTVQSILEKKNIKVNPEWIKIENGQNPEQAVENFLKEYPQFVGSPQSSTQKPMSTQKKNTNVPSNFSPDYKAEKSDPVARAKIREAYRTMLRGGNPLGSSL